MSIIALFAYEYLITLSREVDLFWKRKFTMASALFIVNRYLVLAVNILDMPYSIIVGCVGWSYASSILGVLQYLPWALFSSLRAYVLGSGAWSIALLVLILSMAPVFVNYVNLGYSTVLSNGFQCGMITSLSSSTDRMTCLITSDVLVLCLTWNATYKTSRAIKALGQRVSLSDILFRDGVMYFAWISENTAEQYTSNITVLSEPVTAILISRFIMDLQEANTSMVLHNSVSTVSSLNFNKFIGSIGTSLPAPSLMASDTATTADSTDTEDKEITEFTDEAVAITVSAI
ncbi:hypothetical protein C8Q76DRAFT_782863 [Earliella scabrosa]|nr:hypothetical protein C8Q76DRAFT_782863 [Earliella scabrosa]